MGEKASLIESQETHPLVIEQVPDDEFSMHHPTTNDHQALLATSSFLCEKQSFVGYPSYQTKQNEVTRQMASGV